MAERQRISSDQVRQMYTSIGLGDALRRERVAAHATGEQPTLSVVTSTEPVRDPEVDAYLKGAEVLKILRAVHDSLKRR